MEMKTFKSDSKEVFVEGDGVVVTVNTWPSAEGCNLMVHSDSTCKQLRMAGSFRWEEVDAVLAALIAARSV